MYNGIYKCRLCGESYIRCSTVSSDVVIKHFIGLETDKKSIQQVTLTNMHVCKDGSYGLGIFQGFKKVDVIGL